MQAKLLKETPKCMIKSSIRNTSWQQETIVMKKWGILWSLLALSIKHQCKISILKTAEWNMPHETSLVIVQVVAELK